MVDQQLKDYYPPGTEQPVIPKGTMPDYIPGKVGEAKVEEPAKEEKPVAAMLKCPICGKTSRYQSWLDRHMKSHKE